MPPQFVSVFPAPFTQTPSNNKKKQTRSVYNTWLAFFFWFACRQPPPPLQNKQTNTELRGVGRFDLGALRFDRTLRLRPARKHTEEPDRQRPSLGQW